MLIDIAWWDLTTTQIRQLNLREDERVTNILSNRLRNLKWDFDVSDEDANDAMNRINEKAKATLGLNIVGFSDRGNPRSVIGQIVAKQIL